MSEILDSGARREFETGALRDIDEAKEIANDNFGKAKFICEMTDYEAEASGLDEY